MSVVKVEICRRMPSFSASLVVRSARTCFRRREARLIDAETAVATESAAHLPSTARPGGEGRIRTLPAVDDEPRVDRLLAPSRHHRLDGFRHSPRIESDAEALDADPETHELRKPLRRQRADVLALERQRHGLLDERVRFGDCRFRSRGRQGGLDVSQRGARPFAHRSSAARVSSMSRTSASTVSPERDGRTENDPPRETTWARRGLGSARDTRLASASAPDFGTSTGSTSSTGGLGSTSCLTRRRNESWPACTSAACVAAWSTRSASPG